MEAIKRKTGQMVRVKFPSGRSYLAVVIDQTEIQDTVLVNLSACQELPSGAAIRFSYKSGKPMHNDTNDFSGYRLFVTYSKKEFTNLLEPLIHNVENRWVITKSHNACEGDVATATDEQKKYLKLAGFINRFRLYDDDGELYYSGVMKDCDLPEAEFAPLEDYGMPNAGCTEVRMYNPVKKEWECV